MPIAKVRGVNIFYQVIGDRGPWVALITGGRRGHDEFVPLATKLAQGGYRVVLHDRRNTGRSDVLIEGDVAEEILWLDGRIEVNWRDGSGEGDPTLSIVWREIRGPKIAAVPAEGYGVGLVRDLIPRELGGKVDFDFAADGLCCKFEVPLRTIPNRHKDVVQC